MSADYLEQWARIANNTEINPILDGEEELIEVTMDFIQPQEIREQITCTCDNCRVIANAKKIKIVSKSQLFKFQEFTKNFISAAQENIKSSAEAQVNSYNKQLELAQKNMERLQSMATSYKKLKLKDISALKKDTEKANELLFSIAEEVNSRNGALERVSEDFVREDIVEIINHESVKSIRELDEYHLEILLDRIKVEDALLGPFRLRIPNEGIPRVLKTPDTHLTEDGYYHPHVNQDGYICLGNVDEMKDKLYYQHSLFQRFDITLNLLMNYNPSSPYRTIDQWAPEFCSNCKQGMLPENSVKCDCGAYICDKCAALDMKTSCCNTEVCPKCATKCNICQDVVCKDYIYRKNNDDNISGCEICGKEGCANCIQVCSSCDGTQFICKDCGHYCEECELIECKDCAQVIEEGEDKYYVCKKGHKNKLKIEEDKIRPISFNRNKPAEATAEAV